TGPVADITALFHRLTTWATTRTGPHASADPHAAVAAGLDPVTTDPAGMPDQRGVDARRFDALVGLATDTGAGPREDGRAHAGQCHGPTLNVSLPTLLGLDDEAAWLAGHGAVPADVARELLAAGHPFRRILTDPWTGTVLGVDGHLHHLPATTARTTTTRATDATTTRAAEQPSGLDALKAPGTPATARPTTTARDAGRDTTPDSTGHRPTGTPPAPPPTTTAPLPTGLADKLTRIADAVTPGSSTPGSSTPGSSTPGSSTPGAHEPGVATPPWASARGEVSTDGPPGRPPCPLAGLPTDYVPTAEQSRYIRAALPECTHPGCTVPAVRCDLDHQVPHSAGGPTCECNLRPRCRKHHQCRTHYGWQVEAITDDPTDPYGLGTRWTSPLGLVHDDPAPPFLPRPITGDDDGTPLPTGWDDLGNHPEPTYPTVDMAWPGALALESAATADHRRAAPPTPPAPPIDEDDPPPF
ncbi:HNH endonuclease signature motif containing protein, partial [Pseudokineococcus lusitanus]